mgnify:CR=1 FL=1
MLTTRTQSLRHKGNCFATHQGLICLVQQGVCRKVEVNGLEAGRGRDEFGGECAMNQEGLEAVFVHAAGDWENTHW